MIVIKEEEWNNVPVLIVEPENMQWKELPIFTYFHGYTSAREHNLPIAYQLAAKGFRVLLPEALYHGIRENGISSKDRQLEFFSIIKENLADLDSLYRAAKEKKLLKEDRFAIGGTSMGGITTFAALTQYPWIKAAAVMMGSPKITELAKGLIYAIEQSGTEMPISAEELDQLYVSLNKIDLSMHKEAIGERPIFFWHGEEDPVVPYAHSRTFYESLAADDTNNQFTYVSEPKAGHKVSRKAILAAAAWLEKNV